jgi:hypothetical protein
MISYTLDNCAYNYKSIPHTQIITPMTYFQCSLFSTPSVLLKDSSLCVDVCVLPIVMPRLKIALLDSQRFISLIYLSARKIAR